MGGSQHAAYTGGLAGFMKRGSKASLAAGLGVGGLMLYSGHLIGKDDFQAGHALACGTSAVLAGAMAPRALKSRRFFPAGAVASMGACSAIYQGMKAYQWK